MKAGEIWKHKKEGRASLKILRESRNQKDFWQVKITYRPFKEEELTEKEKILRQIFLVNITDENDEEYFEWMTGEEIWEKYTKVWE